MIGLFNFQIRMLSPSKGDISNLPKNIYVTLVGQVEDEPRTAGENIFCTMKVDRVNGQKAAGSVSVMAKDSQLEYGDRVEIKGKLEELESLSNPGVLSYADYLENKGIRCRIKAVRSPPRLLSRGGNPLIKLSIHLKDRLMLIPQKTLPEPYATLLTSIIFGTRAAGTPQEIKEIYKRAGLAHLLVASGMHLGILVGVCLFAVRSSRLPLWLGVMITTIVNFLYALITGFGPSILRAAIMAEIVLIGLLFEREKEAYTSLALAALIILLFNPKYLFDAGFQLSFAATWSLVYVSPVIHERLKPLMPAGISTVLSAALAPVLATVPITLFHFSQFSVIGVLTNVLLLPWIGAVVVLGFISTFIGALILPLGELVNGANLILLAFAHWIVCALSSLPFAQVFLPAPRVPLVIGYYAGLAGLTEILRRGKFPRLDKYRIMVVSLAVLGLLLWNAALSEASKGLTITVLDVGQGDSILIETPSGRRILVDGGEKKMGERVVVPFLRKKGINKLDMVVLTHPHDDHVGGLPEVLGAIKVDSVLEPGFVFESEAYQRFLDLIRRNKIKYHLARGGQSVSFDEGIEARILHPTLPFLADTNSDANNASIVFRLQYGRFSMLFTGDNEKEGEERILEIFPEASLASTILKVGHHGSSTSTSERFLTAVDPEVAVISCGRHNKFRHPHPGTLRKLQNAGVAVFRTDRNGAVVIKSDGRTFRVEPQK